MRILNSISIALLLFALAKGGVLNAQVTIGVTKKAKGGVLLDLKQSDDDGANSSLGLLLPRVMVEQADQLLPMLDETDYATNSTTKSNQDELHKGLLVYNLNQCLLYTGMDKGGVVWNGSNWDRLGTLTVASVVNTNVDQDNNIFYSRVFGDAGEWMIQNLDVENYTNEGVLSSIGSENTDWMSPDSYYSDANGLAGKLYTVNAALNKTNTELQGTYNQYAVQGVCPDDWRIPTDDDWTNLEKEIDANTSLYSSISDQNLWETGWETETGERGTFGEAMKAICLLVYTDLDNSTDGASNPMLQGGFNVMLTGYQSGTYAEEAKYITSTLAASTPTVYNRLFKKGVDGVYRESSATTDMASIRCIKDVAFTCGSLLTDDQGNRYTTAMFGDQCWMTQNLRTTIGLEENVNADNDEALYYRNTNDLTDENGLLYTWEAATLNAYSTETIMPDEPTTTVSELQGICPTGWVLPSDYDWNTLENTLAGDVLTSADNATEGWVSSGDVGTAMKTTGTGNFGALLVGSSQSGNILGNQTNANFWTSSDVFTLLGTDQQALYRGVQTDNSGAYRGRASKSAMLSIRCVQEK